MKINKKIVAASIILEFISFVINYCLIIIWGLNSAYMYLFFILPANIIVDFNGSINLSILNHYSFGYWLAFIFLVLLNSTKWYFISMLYQKGYKKLTLILLVFHILNMWWISRINDWGS